MVSHGYSNAFNVFHNVAIWGMKRNQGTPKAFSSIIPHASHVLHQGSSNECRGEYVKSTWFYRDMTPRQNLLQVIIIMNL